MDFSSVSKTSDFHVFFYWGYTEFSFEFLFVGMQKLI